MTYSVSIRGIQKLQRDNARRIMAISPKGRLGRAIKYITTELHRYAVAITHVDTGTLRASHRMQLTATRGRIYIAPGSVNPRTGERAAKYGVIEEERGGEHAFYTRTVQERGGAVTQRAIKMIEAAL